VKKWGTSQVAADQRVNSTELVTENGEKGEIIEFCFQSEEEHTSSTSELVLKTGKAEETAAFKQLTQREVKDVLKWN